MFEKIKTYKQERILQTLVGVTRIKSIANLEQVHDIGIIFNVGSEADWNRLYAFVREMEQQKKRVFLIGFQADKQEIDYIFSHAQTSILHEKEDLNFYGMPKDVACEAFTNRHYDLLLDMTEDHRFFARYIAVKSLSDLKVTYVCDSNLLPSYIEQIFDLLIHGSKPFDIADFISEVRRYLGMIKK